MVFIFSSWAVPSRSVMSIMFLAIAATLSSSISWRGWLRPKSDVGDCRTSNLKVFSTIRKVFMVCVIVFRVLSGMK